MKYILSLIISGAFVVSGFGQTRNVLVGTNNAVVQPTNFWSADASNARTGLGLGTAATNSASTFQPSSTALSNLATGNGGALSNLQATNLVGIIPASNISTVTFTNIGGTLAISSGGTGATNAVNARQNLGSTVVGDAVFIATNAAAARTALSLGTAATSSTTDFQPSDSDLTNLANNNAINLTNFPALLLRTNGNGAGLTNLTAANITGLGTAATNPSTAFQSASSVLTNLSSSNAVNLTNLQATNIVGQIPASNISSVNFSNVSGTLSISSGGTGATNAATARTNLGLGWSALTNTDATNFRNAIGLGATWLTNTNVTNFRTGIDLGTNSIVQFGELVVPNLGVGSGTNSYFVANSEFIETALPIEFALNSAAGTRTNLGLPWSGLTNTNAATFQSALFGANTNPVLVNTNGEVVSPTNFWAVAPISTTVQYQTNVTGTSTNAATNSRNLFLFSLAPSVGVTNVTNIVTLPTNPATTFEGDRATITHLANSTNAVTAIRQLGAATNLITLNQLDETVLLMYRSGAWGLADNISYIEPIYFSGTNATANAAASRTNLGLGWIALTNTNSATSLLGFTTNGQVVANTGTNVLTFTNEVRFGSGDLRIDQAGGIYWSGDLRYEPETQTFHEQIQFDSPLTASNTRNNLGLPLLALTNTNNANFQAAVFTTNAAPTNTANVNTVGFNTAVAWMEVTVSTNGTNHSFRIPLFR
jgi:hypothetical protein